MRDCVNVKKKRCSIFDNGGKFSLPCAAHPVRIRTLLCSSASNMTLLGLVPKLFNCKDVASSKPRSYVILFDITIDPSCDFPLPLR